ncbi:MAG: hypothetical protein H6704_23460 [Myxococcales bacterium]|nr:hypothetical protein [Myxococcales bacterium]
MRILLLCTLMLAACGGPSPGPTSAAAVPAADDPAGVVRAWFAATAAGDADAAYALGTPDWAAKERAWTKGFSHAVFVGGDRIEAKTVHPPEVEGDTATVRVRATMHRADGTEDGEGMRFTLTRTPAGWRISDLR